MPFKIVMNNFNIIVQHTIKLFKLDNILHVDKCVLFTFAPPIIPLIYVPGHYINSNVSLNLDASLIPAMDVPGIAKLYVL